MKLTSLLLIVGCSFAFGHCSENQNPVRTEVRDLTSVEKQLVESDNRFGLKLLRTIIQSPEHDNVFISPLSVSMALGMTLNGANGETKAAMEQTLELSGLSSDEINRSYKSLMTLLTGLDPKVAFQIANSIWYAQGFPVRQEFIGANQEFFAARVEALDFEDPHSTDVINGWVNEQTNGKIAKIVGAIDPNVVMFLINAIYFKGLWTLEFDKDLTRNEIFYLPDSSEKICQMMRLHDDLSYFETSAFQAVDLPYGDGLYSMTILLPKPSVSLDSLIAALDSEDWSRWTGSFSTQEVDLSMPKFKLEYETTLNDVLKALGMAVAFEPTAADFSNIDGGLSDLYLSKVKHKTFVQVDEEGTEAAAVTSVEVGVTSVGPTPIRMVVNRPFLFAIREHHSGTILFVGRMVSPDFTN